MLLLGLMIVLAILPRQGDSSRRLPPSSRQASKTYLQPSRTVSKQVMDGSLAGLLAERGGRLYSSSLELGGRATSGRREGNSTAQVATSDEETLCLVRLYVDTLVREHSAVGRVDLNDRLLFLVPLIIIYWRYRHPHESRLPITGIDRLLEEIGDEAQVHRRVLRELAKSSSEECSPASSRQPNRTTTNDETARSNEQEKFALQILQSWFEPSGVTPTSRPEETVAQTINRQDVSLISRLKELHALGEKQTAGFSAAANASQYGEFSKLVQKIEERISR